jgi:replication-associated recombination protein RarA
MGGWRPIKTINGYDMGEVASALQKDIRRGNEENVLFWVAEFDRSNLHEYCWKRLRIICSEDIGLAWPEGPAVIKALYDNYSQAKKGEKANPASEWGSRLYIIHAALLLTRARKSRMVDTALMWIYEKVDAGDTIPIPDYALDQHTSKGKRMGRGQDYFFADGAKLANEAEELLPDPYFERSRESMVNPRPKADRSRDDRAEPSMFESAG